MDPFVSVVIATRNRQTLLAQTLEALEAQRWPRQRFEVVVADNHSTDQTREVAEAAASRAQAPSIQYLFVAEPGKSFAVNAGLLVARGSVIALTDDDVVPDPDWIDRLVAALNATGADFVSGRVVPRWETPAPAWMSPALYGVLAIPDNGTARLAIDDDSAAVMPIGANMAVRRSVIDRLGGLRADLGKLEGTLRTGEDHEFFLRMLRAGCRGVYEPTAVVQHWVPRERLVRSYFRRWFYQNGLDVARVEAGYGSTVRLMGIPRYLWRQVLVDGRSALFALVTGDRRRRFSATLRLVWFSGYLRNSWFGRADIGTAVSAFSERR